jgi:hypothetical protein
MSDYTKWRDRPRTLAKLTLCGYDDKTIGNILSITPYSVARMRRSKKFRQAYAEFQDLTDKAAVALAIARLAGLPADVPQRIISEFYGIGRPMSPRVRRRVTSTRSVQREQRQAVLDVAGSGSQDTHSAALAECQTQDDEANE